MALKSTSMADVNKMLEDMVKDLETKAEALDDKGHLALVADVKNLLERVLQGKYHDFHANGFDAPKVGLVADLDHLRGNAINGLYDN